MKKSLFIILFCGFLSAAFGQDSTFTEYIDTHSRIVLSKEKAAYYKVITPDRQNPDKAHFTTFYLSDKVYVTGSYSSLEKRTEDGQWIQYFENGVRKEDATYREGKLEGVVTSWYENGQKEFEHTYVYGRQVGTSRYWHRNGQLHCAIPHPDVAFSQETYTLTSIADGKVIIYTEDGKIKRESVFYQGEEVEKTCYNATGEAMTCSTPFEKMPEFKGGVQALSYYLGQHIKYPAKMARQNVQGRVFIGFIVGKDGSIEEPYVIESVHPVLDAEALRVVSTMPRWNPGYMFGDAVRVRYVVPISFQLTRR